MAADDYDDRFYRSHERQLPSLDFHGEPLYYNERPLPPLPSGPNHSRSNTIKSSHASDVVISPVESHPGSIEPYPTRAGLGHGANAAYYGNEPSKAPIAGGTVYSEPPYSKTPQNYSNGYYTRQNTDPFADDDAVPLSPQQNISTQRLNSEQYMVGRSLDRKSMEATARPYERGRSRRKRRRPWTDYPWLVYFLSLVQCIVFLVEIIKNGQLTHSPIEIHPTFNPMIGPSPYVMINMGARYVPCMRNQDQIQNNKIEITWPCPNTTTDTGACTLSDLCGFSGVPVPHIGGTLDEKPAPNQWFRFITPIFLHAGIVHIGFNLLMQILLGGPMERAIGPIRFALVYFPAGIFGFIMGGNFAPPGIASTGASGAIFGIMALLFLDLLYTWTVRPSPLWDLFWLILDVIISFIIGLLPGVDNFSHIGGFIMGLGIGLVLLRSPEPLRDRLEEGDQNDKYAELSAGRRKDSKLQRQAEAKGIGGHYLVYSASSDATSFIRDPKGFFAKRKPLWWVWWLIRVAALVTVIVVFIVLLNNFYSHHSTSCSWCKYLTCLPVSNWCSQGELQFIPTSTPAPSSGGS